MRFAQSGFTLIELLTTMAVGAILLGVAVPALRDVTVSSRLTALANAYLSTMSYARSEAIKRNARTVLCKSSNGTDCAGSGDWAQGWIVFHDADNDAAHDDGESLLLVQATLPQGLSMCGNDPLTNYISYAPSGAAIKTGGAFQAGSLYLFDGNTQQTRRIVLSITGRARIERLPAPVCA
jgi:type IV fimbrial biogenesis protein FimT